VLNITKWFDSHVQMLRSFTPDAFAYGLASWSWLGIDGKTPRFTTVFGDVFLESLEGWWLLDTIEGTLTLRWATAVDLYDELDSTSGREEILLEDILMEALQRGVQPRPDEVLTFMPHPVLGGRLSGDSCVAVRFELALRLAGQVHSELARAASPAPSPMLWAPAAPAETWTADQRPWPAAEHTWPGAGQSERTWPAGPAPADTRSGWWPTSR
jgi:hypothetical protein